MPASTVESIHRQQSHRRGAGRCSRPGPSLTSSFRRLSGKPSVGPNRIQTTSSKHSLNMGLSANRSEEHTSELQSLLRISYAVFCLKQQNENTQVRKTTITSFTNIHFLITSNNTPN